MNVALATPDHLDALVELFRACECPCFCRYWHFDGDKNAWLARCTETPQLNEAEMRADVATGQPRSMGLVALEDRAVGWMSLAPRASLPKLRGRSVYRALDLGPDDGVLSIGCMLVRPDARGVGVARALVTAATRVARARGARVIDAFPHAAGSLRDSPERAWMGPNALFVSLGFRRVTGDDAYPVLRFTL